MIVSNKISLLAFVLLSGLLLMGFYLLWQQHEVSQLNYYKSRQAYSTLLQQRQERLKNNALLKQHRSSFEQFDRLGYFSSLQSDQLLIVLQRSKAHFSQQLGSVDYHFLEVDPLPQRAEGVQVDRLGLQLAMPVRDEAALFEFIDYFKQQSKGLFETHDCELRRLQVLDKSELKLAAKCLFYFYRIGLGYEPKN